MHQARESVAVVVKAIRSTGALDHVWSSVGTRDEVVDRLDQWVSEQRGTDASHDLTGIVRDLPAPPPAGRWLDAVGVTAGHLWVWATSREAGPGET